MSIMTVDGFPFLHRPTPLEEILEKRMPMYRPNITTFTITSAGWESIDLKVTDHKHVFHFVANNPKVGNIDAVIDVKDRENAKVIVLSRQGLSNEIDILLEEAIRVATNGYHASLVRPYTTKLVITRYHFNSGVCIQKYVTVHKSAAGNYVVPGYFHGVKPASLGQFYYHHESVEMISLPENLERDRHQFNRCMFRLIRRKTREVIAEQLKKGVTNAIKDPESA